MGILLCAIGLPLLAYIAATLNVEGLSGIESNPTP
jgi:hypothetical protein